MNSYFKIKSWAVAHYPPNTLLINRILEDLGSKETVSKLLGLGENGADRIRTWISGERKIPLSAWVLLSWERSLKLVSQMKKGESLL